MKRTKRENLESKTGLVNRTTIKVRFNEVDSLRVVWHGHYLKYFEDGREAFGRQYAIGYHDFYDHNLVTPIVDINCHYKKHLAFGDEVIVETEFINTSAAKIIFEYNLFKKQDMSLVATGRSVQVFLDTEGELQLVVPQFFMDWKSDHDLSEL